MDEAAEQNERNRLTVRAAAGDCRVGTMKMRSLLGVLGAVLLFLASGCGNPREPFGRTWYIDGAGNWGFGVLDVPQGLADKGYRGAVTNHRWSLTLNPALDQTLRFVARGSGQMLGGEITNYLKKYPKADANIIALSAGTGVGIWAIESVKPPWKVSNYIMLGSSLSSRYDARKALANMKGKIVVYYTSTDPVLQGPVRALGTIDGTFDDSAGLVGLRGPGSETGRIVNVARSTRHAALGWTGGHADCTNRRFVAAELSRWIVPGGAAAQAPPQKPTQAPSANPAPPSDSVGDSAGQSATPVRVQSGGRPANEGESRPRAASAPRSDDE